MPMDNDGSGVDLDVLEAKIKADYESRPRDLENNKFWAMFYTIPTFHNPTGVVLSPEKSKKLIQLARKYDFLILCDDVYNLLHYGPGSKSPKRLYAYDDPADSDFKVQIVKSGIQTDHRLKSLGCRI